MNHLLVMCHPSQTKESLPYVSLDVVNVLVVRRIFVFCGESSWKMGPIGVGRFGGALSP